MMTSTQVVETSVNVPSKSPQDYTHPDDRNLLTFGLIFAISDRLNEKDRTGISNAEQLTPVIMHNEVKVFDKDMTKVLDPIFS